MPGSTAIDLADLADSLGMPVGAYGRRRGDGRFSRAETTRLLRIHHVLDLAQRLLGDRTLGLRWLQHQNHALRFETPLSQLESKAGTDRVITLLRRIESGAFA